MNVIVYLFFAHFYTLIELHLKFLSIMSDSRELPTIPSEVPAPLIHPRYAFYSSQRPEFRTRRHKLVQARLEAPAAEPETLNDLKLDPPDAVAMFLRSEVLLAMAAGQASSPLVRSEAFAARAHLLDKNSGFEDFLRDAEVAAGVNGTVDAASLDALLQAFYDAPYTNPPEAEHSTFG